MEKTKEITKEVKTIEHSFYCDECGKHLGTSEEHEDGWYSTYGNFESKCYVYGWYSIEKCLCDNCRNKFVNNFEMILKNLGFKKG